MKIHVGAGPRACPNMGNHRGLPLRINLHLDEYTR
jgi:hypothetical protein